ncbi:hypothetical protein [Sphingopyxis sp. PET50]|nr:hypothetical protein [Sphingopyxis sp. PET50]
MNPPSATAAAITSDRAMLALKTVRQSAFAAMGLRLAMLKSVPCG